jgi:3-oxoacyl-[acyl-carrier-protein] synthase III
MAGILSIGWYVPGGRRDRDAISRDYGVSADALDQFGLESHTLPEDDDHPSTMGARATQAALAAARLEVSALDLLIFAGVTRDFPPPWVAAFGVLHELGANQAAGFDLNNRCTGIGDALWVATALLRSGAYRTIAVCAADRFDYLIGPPRKVQQLSDTTYAAGASAAILSRDAENEIVAFSSKTNDDLSIHAQGCATAGGTRAPLTPFAVEQGRHRWHSNMNLAQMARLMKYLEAADRYNITRVSRSAGFDAIDFLTATPLDAKAQLAFFEKIGIGPEKTLLTVPQLGHMGGADLLVNLGLAIAIGRDVGQRVVISTRSIVYAIAMAIKAKGSSLRISVNGTGLDLEAWRERDRQRLARAPRQLMEAVSDP